MRAATATTGDRFGRGESAARPSAPACECPSITAASAHHGDEREYAHLLGVPPDRDPHPRRLASYPFRSGVLDTEAQYVDLLSTVTGASETARLECIDDTRLDPGLPAEHEAVLSELAVEHALVLLATS